MATVPKKTATGKKTTTAAQASSSSYERRPSGRSDEHSQKLWLQFTKDPESQQLRNE